MKNETIDPKSKTIPRSPELTNILHRIAAPEMKLIKDMYFNTKGSILLLPRLNLIHV
jgi:hypothetical protein